MTKRIFKFLVIVVACAPAAIFGCTSGVESPFADHTGWVDDPPPSPRTDPPPAPANPATTTISTATATANPFQGQNGNNQTGSGSASKFDGG